MLNTTASCILTIGEAVASKYFELEVNLSWWEKIQRLLLSNPIILVKDYSQDSFIDIFEETLDDCESLQLQMLVEKFWAQLVMCWLLTV